MSDQRTNRTSSVLPGRMLAAICLGTTGLAGPAAAQQGSLLPQDPRNNQPGQQDPRGQFPAGQNPYGQNPYGQNPSGQNPYGPGANTVRQLPPWIDPSTRTQFDPTGIESAWITPESFQGFPVFPPNLGGYGGYPPPPAGLFQPPTVSTLPPPTVVPVEPDWPAWLEAKRPEDVPYDLGTALLVRLSDRVWLREADDDVFVPLYHWDTTRALAAGSEVEVRKTGDFLMLFHGGMRLESLGHSKLRIAAMAEDSARLEVSVFERLELTAFERGFELLLPDGSELRSLPVPAEALSVGTTRLYLDRVDEPRWYGGRMTVFNGGARAVMLLTPFGDATLQPGRRVTLFLTPPDEAIGAPLTVDGASSEADGPRRRFRCAEGAQVATVEWSGARFRLSPDATLELDPMLGAPFDPSPSPPEQPAGAESPADASATIRGGAPGPLR